MSKPTAARRGSTGLRPAARPPAARRPQAGWSRICCRGSRIDAAGRRAALSIPRALFAPPVARRSGSRSASAAASIWPARRRAIRDIGFIGCEPFLNGVATLLAPDRAGEQLDNVRILADDARGAADAPARCQRRSGSFCCSPIPGRSAATTSGASSAAANLDALARVLADGAELRIATDDMGYLALDPGALTGSIRISPGWPGGPRTGASRRPTGRRPATRRRRSRPAGTRIYLAFPAASRGA